MKLSDFVIDLLVHEGIRHVFLVSGGAVVHLVDSAARHPKITYVCTQHEQAAGTAADGYARMKGLGVALVTSGPGPTNLVTSVANCFYDSIPAVFLCGQVATFRIKKSKQLRQKGFQETDIVSIFSSITKYTNQIRNAQDIQYELQKAIYLAKSGRPGPVVIDIPDDIQRGEIQPQHLRSFHPSHKKIGRVTSLQVKNIVSAIQKSKRPVMILGAGVRNAHVTKEAISFARHFKLPVLLTWGGMDLMPYEDELNMGGLGACGPRCGNFAVQTADVVIAIGTRLSQLITGGRQDLFAPHAKKVMVDVDGEELDKFSPDIFTLDIKIHCDLPDFFQLCRALYTKPMKDRYQKWRARIRAWRQKYPICPQVYYNQRTSVNPYVFIKELSSALNEQAIIFADTGANLSWTMQAFEVKKGQRILSAWNHTPMGYALPASIGASLGRGREIICLIGDGGLMMCLAELATVVRYKIPVKIFIFNNHGHGIQRQTLDTWMQSRYTAIDEKTGLSFPDFIKVGKTFGITSISITHQKQLKDKIEEVLGKGGPVLCNVEIMQSQRIVPMLKFGESLENLNPKLSDKEMEEIMAMTDER